MIRLHSHERMKTGRNRNQISVFATKTNSSSNLNVKNVKIPDNTTIGTAKEAFRAEVKIFQIFAAIKEEEKPEGETMSLLFPVPYIIIQGIITTTKIKSPIPFTEREGRNPIASEKLSNSLPAIPQICHVQSA